MGKRGQGGAGLCSQPRRGRDKVGRGGGREGGDGSRGLREGTGAGPRYDWDGMGYKWWVVGRGTGRGIGVGVGGMGGCYGG